jgi:hypothetical protein
MGCKGSKDAGAVDKKIDYTFKWTNFGSFDKLFQDASTVLETCEKIRGGLEDNKEDGMEIAGTDQLVDPKYVETLRVLFWAMSAGGKGKKVDLGLEVVPEKPYISVDPTLFNEETRKLYTTFKDYVTTVTDAPGDLDNAIKALQALTESVPDAVKSVKGEIEASSLNFKQKADALVIIKKNSQKLPKELEKCKRLQEVLKEAATDLKQTIPELKTLWKSADETGTKANDAKLYKPKEIFDKFHTGEITEEAKKARAQAKTA